MYFEDTFGNKYLVYDKIFSALVKSDQNYEEMAIESFKTT